MLLVIDPTRPLPSHIPLSDLLYNNSSFREKQNKKAVQVLLQLHYLADFRHLSRHHDAPLLPLVVPARRNGRRNKRPTRRTRALQPVFVVRLGVVSATTLLVDRFPSSLRRGCAVHRRSPTGAFLPGLSQSGSRSWGPAAFGQSHMRAVGFTNIAGQASTRRHSDPLTGIA
jgi:hypothetical protein